MKSRTVRLATGLRYHLLEWGADDPSLERTVVLLHGFLDLCWGWEPVVRSGLDGRFHILAPDMRGHGDSDRVGAGGYYHFFDYLADLEDLIEKLGRGRLSLVGHSMGGSIASYFAGTFPERVEHLALLEGTGPPEQSTPVPDRVKSWLAGWRRARERRPREMKSLEEAAARLRKNDPLLDQERALWLAEKATTRGEDGLVRFKHDPLHLTLGPYPYRVDVARQFWERIRCPVLLVEGTESRLKHSEEEAAERRAAFSGAASIETRLLPGAGHMMQRHQPEPLAKLLAGFLGEPAPSPAPGT